MYDAYVSDEWRPTSNVTLQLGLRYEYQADAFNQGVDINDMEVFPTTGTERELPYVDFSNRGDKNNWGPRAGLAWDLMGDGRSVVRAGYGLYFHPLSLANSAAEVQNYRQPTATIRNSMYPDPYGGLDPETFVSTNPQNIKIFDNNLENLESRAYTVGLSQELSSTLAIHLDGVVQKMTKTPVDVDINPRSGMTTGPRPLPAFGRIYQTQSVGYMNYKALFARLEKRYSSGHMYMISYTLADSESNLASSSFFTVRTDAWNPDSDVGPNNNDRRHTVVVSGAVLIPGGINLSGVLTARSTMPFSAQAGSDLNGDAANSDFVPGTTRNVFNRGNDSERLSVVNEWRAGLGLSPINESQIDTNEYIGVDLRVTKSFPIRDRQQFEVIFQVFNLLDRTNLLSSWVTNGRSNAFGTSRAAAAKRQAEVAVRFAF
jgi:hypothetical protein